MKIAIPSDDGRKIAGHAGQARQWLVYDSDAIDAAPEPAVRNGEALPKPPFNPHLLFCKIRDLFSKH